MGSGTSFYLHTHKGSLRSMMNRAGKQSMVQQFAWEGALSLFPALVVTCSQGVLPWYPAESQVFCNPCELSSHRKQSGYPDRTPKGTGSHSGLRLQDVPESDRSNEYFSLSHSSHTMGGAPRLKNCSAW